MFFSIVTASYNNLEGLRKTVESINLQSCTDYEHIIVDGKSTDGTPEYLKLCESDKRCFVSEKDTGISNAFNKGLRMCSGEYILFLNTGDTFNRINELDIIKSEIQSANVEVMTYAANYYAGTLPAEISPDKDEYNWSHALIPHQAAFVRKDVFERIGGFNEFLRLRMDYDFFFRCVKASVVHKYIPRTIVTYEEGGASHDNREVFNIEGASVWQLYNKTISEEVMWNMISIYRNHKNLDEYMCDAYPFADKRDIAVYGAGTYGMNFVEKVVNDQKRKLVCVFDRAWDKKREQFEHMNMKIDAPENIGEYHFEVIAIAIVDKNVKKQVREYLINLGVDENKIVYV